MLFGKKPHDSLILVLDLQSSLVRASLIKQNSTHTPLVVFSFTAPVAFKPHTTSTYLIKMTLRAVGDAVQASLRFVHNHHKTQGFPSSISSVHYVLSAPWIVSQAKTMSIAFPEDTIITRQYILGLIAAERAKMSAPNSGDIRVIEEKIFDVRLNGYSVVDWNGKKTKQLEVSYTTSIAGARMAEKLVEACAHAAHAQHVHFHSSIMLQSMAIKELFPRSESYVLVHVHGGLTEIAVIKHSVCTFFGSIPFGSQTVVQKVAHAAHIDEHAAHSLLTLHTADKLEPSADKKTTTMISDISQGWSSEFDKLCTMASPTHAIIQHMYMTVESHGTFFIHAIKKANTNAQIQEIALTDIEPLVTYERLVEHTLLVGLHAIALHSIS